MLSGDEAVVVVLGLLAARRQGLESSEGSVDGAPTKIHRVLPDLLRRRVEALETTLGFTAAERTGAPVGSDVALLVAEAIRRGRRLAFGYRAFTGDETARDVSPHGLVVHSGRWYLAAYDHVRADRRTFRVDRMRKVALSDGLWLAPPTGFDAVAHVSRSLANVPWRWEVVVRLDLTVDEGRPRIPATVAELVEQDGDAAAHARRLAGLDGRRPRPPRLPLHDRRAGRAAGERPRARRPAHGVARRGAGCAGARMGDGVRLQSDMLAH